MSLNELMIFAENPDQLSRDLSQLDEEVTSITAGITMYGNISFSPMGNKFGTYRADRELRLGFGLHAPKEAMITYKNETMDTSIVYCNSHGEFTLEAAYLHKGTLGKAISLVLGLWS